MHKQEGPTLPLSSKHPMPIKITLLSSNNPLPMCDHHGPRYPLCTLWCLPHQDPPHSPCRNPQDIRRDPSNSIQKGSIYSQVLSSIRASLAAQRLKRLPPIWETWVRSLGWEDPLEKEMVTHSSILAWRIPWTEEPGKLQSTGSQRVGHNWVTSVSFSLSSIMPESE